MNRIKELRLKRGLTLKELGKKVNMHTNTLSRYETGKRNPPLFVWQLLADFYGVSVPYLQGMFDHLTKEEALSIIHEIMSASNISKKELKEKLNEN